MGRHYQGVAEETWTSTFIRGRMGTVSYGGIICCQCWWRSDYATSGSGRTRRAYASGMNTNDRERKEGRKEHIYLTKRQYNTYL